MKKALVASVLAACIVIAAGAGGFFQDNFEITYGGAHVQPSADGSSVTMLLDSTSGANFRTTKAYLYGGFSAQMQLPQGDSAGVCTAYFLLKCHEDCTLHATPSNCNAQLPQRVCVNRIPLMTSQGNNHDELDWEFLGNVTGEPYIIQTNVFANGVGGREERFYLWFDPRNGFHTYEVVWNSEQVTFLVDGTVIRIYGNHESLGVSYPSQSMSIFASIFDASTWATRGGAVPIDYTKGPFKANYQDFNLDGCLTSPGGSSLAACTADASSWWSQPDYRTLSSSQITQLRWVRQNYLQYSYCTDTSRYPTPPAECGPNNP